MCSYMKNSGGLRRKRKGSVQIGSMMITQQGEAALCDFQPHGLTLNFSCWGQLLIFQFYHSFIPVNFSGTCITGKKGKLNLQILTIYRGTPVLVLKIKCFEKTNLCITIFLYKVTFYFKNIKNILK